MKIFITGTAGFIGFHLARRLLQAGHEVTGYDGLTDYYDTGLKVARVEILDQSPMFNQVVAMLEDEERLESVIQDFRPEIVIHLAAQAGVRYSIESPATYIQSNIKGTFNMLEAMRRHVPSHFLMASTSSVYGANVEIPFTETDRISHPLSLYAATKSACESMSHAYSHLFEIPTTCFRFFTVYGPWGRPDMALFKFVRAIREGQPIDVYGHGQMRRDFTYVDDLVAAIVDLVKVVPKTGVKVHPEDTISPVAPIRTVNIGGGRPTGLMQFISAVEVATGHDAVLNLMDMQAGDVVQTFASTRLLNGLIGPRTWTSVEDGVAAFVRWYDEHSRATPSKPAG